MEKNGHEDLASREEVERYAGMSPLEQQTERADALATELALSRTWNGRFLFVIFAMLVLIIVGGVQMTKAKAETRRLEGRLHSCRPL